MKREEIMNLDFDQLEARSAEITAEIKNAETVDQLDAFEMELEAIEERKKILNLEVEKRKKDIDAIVRGAGDVIEKEGEVEKMPNLEVRKSPEYLDAWVEYQKGRATEEQRALLTENAENGTIAVPVYVEDQIHTAWESNEIVKRVKRSYFKGNLKVGYEASASGAVVHEEGDEAITEENLVVAYIDLIPAMIKKMVRVSDEVIDMRGQVFLDYIFDEVEYQLVKAIGDNIIKQITTAQTSALVAEVETDGAAISTADIIAAEGLLGGEATNPVFITTRSTAAALKAAALSANYGYDPFDGLEPIYVDAAALSGKVGVVADLSGVQLNLPNGDAATFKFDDTTEADADMVRIIGRLYAAIGVVAPGKVVRIALGE